MVVFPYSVRHKFFHAPALGSVSELSAPHPRPGETPVTMPSGTIAARKT